jgi:dipeptidase D
MDDKTQQIIDIFQQISSIPRCSKKEEKIIQWLAEWAQEKQFAIQKDPAGNILISVPATSGYEQAPVIVFQGHTDMVCEKTPESRHDFSTDPIQLVFDGDWLRADGTSLGADNGIAIAVGLALAGDQTVEHPPLELLFTVDEETGLNGAKKLEAGFISGKIFINIDSEAEGVFTVGCAGGRDAHINLPMQHVKCSDRHVLFNLSVQGLRGGHSGIDIHKARANANKLLARVLHQVKADTDIHLVSFKGGTAHNAIARDATAAIAFEPEQADSVMQRVAAFEKIVKNEYALSEPTLRITLAKSASGSEDAQAVVPQDLAKMLNLILALPHGVAGMSAAFQGLVETSSNVAKIETTAEGLQILTSQRSLVQSKLDELVTKVKAISALANATATSENEYPPWQPDLDSPLLKRSVEVYRSVFNQEPVVESIHAGLECAIIGAKYPGIDMISVGPTMKSPHSPDEALFLPSLIRVWDFLTALLKSYNNSQRASRNS